MVLAGDILTSRLSQLKTARIINVYLLVPLCSLFCHQELLYVCRLYVDVVVYDGIPRL